MTVRAIVGVTVFNVLLTALGTAVLFALRPRSSRRALLRLAGVSYLLGVAVAMVVLTLLIVVGISVTALSTVLALLLIAVGSAAIGARRKAADRSTYVHRPSRFMTVPNALILAAVVVLLEAIFRKGRLQGLLEFDGWDSWGPRTGALYHFGEFDTEFLDGLPGGSYPPGLPAVLASALHAIDSADMVTVHLQYWFLGVGLVAAFVGLLAVRVGGLLLLPFVLLVFVMPDIRSRSVDMYADLPMGFAIAAAALLVAIWLETRRGWHLPAAAILLAGATLTKREGILLSACVVVAALVASSDRIKTDWPRLAAVFLAAFAAWVPWQVWVKAKALPGTGPAEGIGFVTDLGRGWDAFVAVTENLFEYDLWLLSMTIAIAAVALCVLARARRLAVYLGSLLAVSVLGCTVILWSDSNLQLTDVNVVSRLVGTVALLAALLSPLALQRAWEGPAHNAQRNVGPAPAWRLVLAWAVVAGAAIAYPATLLAEGGARFPSASDCVAPPSESRPLIVVYGYASSYPEANMLRRRAVETSDRPVRTAQDGCGRIRVFAGDVRTRAAAAELMLRARAGGLSPSLEAQPTG